MTDKFSNLRASLAALKLGGPVSTDPGKWNAATDALDVELVAELLAERDAMVQAQPAAVSDAEIDRICYLATEIRFAKTDDSAQAVIDKIRAILALRPQDESEPFGYFRALPFGWEQCGEHDEGAKALYERPQSVPMSRDGLKLLMSEAGYVHATAQEKADFINGFRHAEAHHGITAQADGEGE